MIIVFFKCGRKEKTTEVYQQQVSIVMRMKHEIIQLKCMVSQSQTPQ